MAAQYDEQTINMLTAQIEQEALSDMVNRLQNTCQKKCVSPKYIEGELNKAETVCCDRCVSKYIEVQKQIDTKFGVEMQQGQQKMQSLQEAAK